MKDERCSRTHAEIFFSQDRWVLRDLESRNGTIVGSERVRGDYMLQPGDVIRVGHSQLAFVHDLAAAFPDSSTAAPKRPPAAPAETVMSVEHDDEAHVMSAATEEPTKITHRRGQTRFLAPVAAEEDAATPKVGRAAAQLCRLAFEMAKIPDLRSVHQGGAGRAI